jgi:hypothetical protein
MAAERVTQEAAMPKKRIKRKGWGVREKQVGMCQLTLK